MKLYNTEKYMQDLISRNFLDSYIIVAGIHGEKAVISSSNVNDETLFDIASMGKVLVTSTLILRAIGEKLLSLDDTVDRFFPDVPEDKREITVEQLLTHTSGIVRIVPPDDVAEAGRSAVAEFILKSPLAFKPSEGYIYSCCGYVLLGYIAEIIFGEPLDILYEKYIKKPLGLTRSKFNMSKEEENAAVTHYRAEAGEFMVADNIAYKLKGIAGNGASFWCARDILKYIEAVFDRSELLYPKNCYYLAEKDYTPNFEEGRGLGYLIVDSRFRQTGKLFPAGSFGHCGNTGTSFFMNRSDGLFVIALTNATRFSYMRRNYAECDYNEIMDMREKIHNALYDDICGRQDS